MPELPEVESLRRSLEPYLLNQTISAVEVGLPKIVSSHGTKRESSNEKVAEFIVQLSGRTIVDLGRRAKNLIFYLDNGSVVLAHLKMTGQFVYQPKESDELIFGGHPIERSETELPNKHTYITFYFDAGTLYFNDVRQFGYVLWYPDYNSMLEAGHLQNLGVEPLSDDFEEAEFVEEMSKRTGVLKKVLLDQKVVAGLGNIYADEACFLSGIKPQTKVSKLSKNKLHKLYRVIKYVIPRAVELGGSSVANYLLADGSRGNYAREHWVYQRGGKPCKLCGTILKSQQLAGRTTVWCPHDQR